MLSLPKLVALLGLDFLLGSVAGWTVAGLLTRRGRAKAGQAPESSAFDVSAVLHDVTDLAERHAAGLEQFSHFRREGADGAAAVDEVIAARREANDCWLRLFADRRDTLDAMVGKGWESCRSAAEALTGYHELVESFSEQLGGTNEDLATSPTLGAVVSKLLEANLQLGDSLVKSLDMLLEYDEQLREAERSARVDPLTGLPNRRAFEEQLRRLHSRWALGEGKPFSLILFDIDRFKTLNDELGHECGDEVLRMIANLLRDESRACDHVSRWGGEEFAVLAAHTSAPGAEMLANRLRNRVAASVLHKAGQVVQCTVSGGIAEIGQASNTRELFKFADAALFEAKDAGRNVIRVAERTPLDGTREAIAEPALQPA